MDDLLRNRIEDKVRKTLLTSIRSDTNPIMEILSFNEKEFSFLVDEVFKSESKAVSIAFREKKSISLPAFGYFKFKPAREKIFEEIRKTVAVYGYNKLSEVKDPLLRGLIMNNIKPIIKQIYFDHMEHNKCKNEVLGNIFKK